MLRRPQRHKLEHFLPRLERDVAGKTIERQGELPVFDAGISPPVTPLIGKGHKLLMGTIDTSQAQKAVGATVVVPRPRLHLRRFHGVLAPNASLPAEIIPSGPVNANAAAEDQRHARHHSAVVRMRGARLLKRVFDIDIEQCSQCGGTLKISAAIEDPIVIAKILTHLGLPARAPPRSSARLLDRLEIA